MTKNGSQLADYNYDLAGRLTVFNETPDDVACTTTFIADKTAERVLGDQDRRWTYDAAGNVTHDDLRVGGSVVNSRDHTWDALGRYTSTNDSQNGETTYYYTTSNKLSRVIGPGSLMSASDELFVGDWARFDMTGLTWVYRILVNGKVIGEQNGSRFEMPHRTYDGSVLAVSDDLGNVIRQEEFLPYGARSGGSGAGFFEDHFQGNRTDKLMVAGTRAYDMNGGMWLGRDPLVLGGPYPLVSDARLASMYGFDNANPLRYRDPTGTQAPPSPPPDEADPEETAATEAASEPPLPKDYEPIDEEARDPRDNEPQPTVFAAKAEGKGSVKEPVCGSPEDTKDDETNDFGWKWLNQAVTEKEVALGPRSDSKAAGDKPSENGTITLYRAVGQAEYDQLMSTGKFAQGMNSLGGKFFAESAADAAKWGDQLEGPGNYRIISAELPESTADQFMRWDRLDAIGPARYGELNQLTEAVVRSVK